MPEPVVKEDNSLQGQLNDMFNNPTVNSNDHDFSFFGGENPGENLEEKKDENVEDDVKSDDVELKEEVQADAVEEKVEVVEEGKEEVKEGKTNSELLEELKQLRALVNNLSDKKAEVKEAEVEVVKDLLEEDAFKDLVEELNLDENSAKKLGTVLKLVMLKSEQSAVEKVMRETPNVVNSTIQNKETLSKIREKFYSDHPILAEFPDLVSVSANTLAKEDNTLTMQELLNKTAEKVYKVLGVDKDKIKQVGSKQKGEEAGKGKKPAFAESSGSRKAPEKKSDFQQQIDAMMSAIDA